MSTITQRCEACGEGYDLEADELEPAFEGLPVWSFCPACHHVHELSGARLAEALRGLPPLTCERPPERDVALDLGQLEALAQRGDPWASLTLAALSAEGGFETERDLERARFWCDRASAGDDPETLTPSELAVIMDELASDLSLNEEDELPEGWFELEAWLADPSQAVRLDGAGRQRIEEVEAAIFGGRGGGEPELELRDRIAWHALRQTLSPSEARRFERSVRLTLDERFAVMIRDLEEAQRLRDLADEGWSETLANIAASPRLIGRPELDAALSELGLLELL